MGMFGSSERRNSVVSDCASGLGISLSLYYSIQILPLALVVCFRENANIAHTQRIVLRPVITLGMIPL